MNAPLPQADQLRADYERDGFIFHRQPVLAPDLLARARQALLDVRDGRYATGRTPAPSPWKPGVDLKALCKVEQPQRADTALLDAVSAPELGQVIAAAVGAKEFVQVWWVQLLHKPGDGGNAGPKVGWHQDLTYWTGWDPDSELFTAWLALDDVGPDSGPMRYVAGSHRWGLRRGGDFFAQDLAGQRAAIGLPAGETWREAALTVPAGGFGLHHRLLVHGSGANTSPRPRLSLAIHLRTERSSHKPGTWEAEFLDDPATCPVIWRAG